MEGSAFYPDGQWPEFFLRRLVAMVLRQLLWRWTFQCHAAMPQEQLFVWSFHPNGSLLVTGYPAKDALQWFEPPEAPVWPLERLYEPTLNGLTHPLRDDGRGLVGLHAKPVCILEPTLVWTL